MTASGMQSSGRHAAAGTDWTANLLGRIARRAAAVALCAACSRSPPPTHDIDVPEKWDVGEVVTRTERNEHSITIRTEVAGGHAAPGRSRLDESRIVQRCLETDEQHALRRSLVHVASWALRENDVEDRSLEGAFVETSPAGWTLVSTDVRPSSGARRWLDERFGPGSGRDLPGAAGFRAPHPIAVGESWIAPGAEFVRASLGATELLPMGSDADFLIRLEGVTSTPDGESVHVTETLDAPVTSAPSAAGSGGVRYEAGTRTTMHGDFTFVPGRAHRSSVKTTSGETTIVMLEGGEEVRALQKSATKVSSVAGGEMPDPPPK